MISETKPVKCAGCESVVDYYGQGIFCDGCQEKYNGFIQRDKIPDPGEPIRNPMAVMLIDAICNGHFLKPRGVH